MPPPRQADAEAVLRILRAHVGRDHPISARLIALLLGHPDGRYADRPVRATIRKLRRDGRLILSTTETPAGYFLAANAEEWRRYGHSMRRRAFDLLATVRAMEETAGAQFGASDGPSKQIEMGLELGLTF